MRHAVLTLALVAVTLAAACGGDKERIEGQNDAAATQAARDTTSTPASGATPEATRRSTNDGVVSISVFDLRIDDCIADDRSGNVLEGEVGDVLVAPCEHPSVIGQVFDLVLMEDPPNNSSPYPGEDATREESIDACDNAAPYTFLYPLDSSWSNGDRTIVCIYDFTALYEVGRCVDDQDGAVACENEFATRIVTALIDVSEGHPDIAAYPGEAFFEGVFQDDCRSDDDYYLFPSASSWERGDREVVCTRPLE
jgi:hypothetical protein